MCIYIYIHILSWYVWYRWWLLYPQSKPMFCFNLEAGVRLPEDIYWDDWDELYTVQPTLLPMQIRSSVPSDISTWRVTPMIIWNAKFHGTLDPFIHINLFLLIFWCPFVPPPHKKSDPFLGTAGSFGFQDVMRLLGKAVWVGNWMSFGPSGFLGHMEIFFGETGSLPTDPKRWTDSMIQNGPWSKISCVCVCMVVGVWVELFNHISSNLGISAVYICKWIFDTTHV